MNNRQTQNGWPVNSLGILTTDPLFPSARNLIGADSFWFTDDDGLTTTGFQVLIYEAR
jgi:hypothetical protein